MLIRDFSDNKYNKSISLLRPQSGIDKIKLLLNRDFITPAFQEAVKINNPYTVYPGNNMFCLEKRGNYFLIIINQEALNFDLDILVQVNQIILDLVNNGFLMQTPASLLGNGLGYIIHLSEIEFYFDNNKKHFWVLTNKCTSNLDQAKENWLFFRYSKDGEITDTFYSNDYIPATSNKAATPSQVSIYDKELRDLNTIVNKKGITHAEQESIIKSHPYKTRLEFRLSRDNCQFLNIQNIQGTYSQVLGKYKELLAVLYNRYCFGNVFYDMRTNPSLDRIVKKANDISNIIRFTNIDGKLLKS